jgi:hypothetical protein
MTDAERVRVLREALERCLGDDEPGLKRLGEDAASSYERGHIGDSKRAEREASDIEQFARVALAATAPASETAIVRASNILAEQIRNAPPSPPVLPGWSANHQMNGPCVYCGECGGPGTYRNESSTGFRFRCDAHVPRRAAEDAADGKGER